MDKVKFEEALQNETLNITDKYLVVETRHDGYTNKMLGGYAYKVIAEGDDYKVFPVYLDRKNDTYVNAKYPVILTDGEEILFSKGVMDPYGGPHPEQLQVNPGQSKEQNVLHAFDAYVKEAYHLSVYHIMVMGNDHSVVESDEPFEKTDKFEREIVHPFSETHRGVLPNKNTGIEELITRNVDQPEPSDVLEEGDNIDGLDNQTEGMDENE